jgi:hypothetical protein
MAGWPTPMAGSLGTDTYNPAGNTDSSRKTVALVAGWGTPTVQDAKHATLSPSEQKRDPNNLRNQVHTAGWNTPRATDGSNGGPNQAGGALPADAAKAMPVSGWVTPSTRDWKDTPGMARTGTNPDGSTRTRLDQLPRQAQLVSGWATPSASDEKWRYSTPEAALRRMASGKQVSLEAQANTAPGPTTTSSPAQTEKRAALAPAFSLWLMGFPPEWESCAPLATRSSRKSRQSS